MTEEREVLSAEEVAKMRGFTFYQVLINADEPPSQQRKAVETIVALAQSHEALRACLDETRRERDGWKARSVELETEEICHRLQIRDTKLEAAEAERDEARADAEALERMGRSYSDLWRQEKERAEALARAAGSATDALRQGVEIASQFMNTGRGDLDGWIDSARSALAVLGHATPAAEAEITYDDLRARVTRPGMRMRDPEDAAAVVSAEPTEEQG